MGDYKHLSDVQLEDRAAAARRTVEEQRRFEAAYAEAETRLRTSGSVSTPTAAAPPETRQLAAPVAVHGKGPRAQWARDTWGGKLARLVVQPDEAAELAAAKQLADEHELTYGSRPDLAQCLHKVRGSGTGAGTVLEGGTADALARIRQANPDQPIQMVVGPDPVAAQVGGVVTAPGRGPEATGDAGLAAATLGQLARRR